jgi:hypothetical protein
MANYNSLKNAGMLKPVANTDLGSPTNTYGNLYMSGNVSLNGTLLNSSNAIAPRVASIAYLGNDTAANPAGGATITLTGSGFVGSSVYIGGTIAGSVSVVSSTQLTFTAPAKTAGSYSLSVVNSDGATATFVPGMQYSGIPAWSTSAGSLGGVAASGSVNFTVTATSDSTVTYSVVSGSLPSGVSLNSSTGVISGTAPVVSSSTTYNFTIRATDSENQDTDRNFSMNVTVATVVEYLAVAGGGGGGARRNANFGAQSAAGGGGAGGLLSGSVTLNAGTYTITIGAGGAGGTAAGTNDGSTGENSIISGTGLTTITCYGGGGGGGCDGQSAGSGKNGGSGGGVGDASQYNGGRTPGKGVYPGSSYISATRQGYDGGPENNTSIGGGAGGGGAGGAGNAQPAGYTASGGAGGVGIEWPASSGTYYAGGGGGGRRGGTAGAGGNGGGGAGGSDSSPTGVAGTPNTGGGGGAASTMTNGSEAGANGGLGGSGVVILRYSDSNPAASATTGSPTITVAGGYRVYKFTSSGSITF